MNRKTLQELIRHHQQIIDLLTMERLLEPADDKPTTFTGKLTEEERNNTSFQATGDLDTHRTVTLRIPKGMRIGEAVTSIRRGVGVSDFYLWLCEAPDTDLQKALDEVEHE